MLEMNASLSPYSAVLTKGKLNNNLNKLFHHHHGTTRLVGGMETYSLRSTFNVVEGVKESNFHHPPDPEDFQATLRRRQLRNCHTESNRESFQHVSR